MPFHQRNQMSPADVQKGKRQARNQEQVIRAFFEANPHLRLTPPEVLHALWDELGHCPLTSVRRALTDLTEAGVLVKYQAPKDQKPGAFGFKNCVWGLKQVEVFQETLWGDE